MTRTYDVGVPQGAAEAEALAEILGVCFNAEAERLRHNFEAAGGLGSLRCVRDVGAGRRVVGGLMLVPMGQWFGGRSVPMQGVAAVGVDPAYRGRGAASVLMREAMRELATQGVPLSTLYPATLHLYRSAGYELAGSRWEVNMPLKGMATRAGELEVRSADSLDFQAMQAAYDRFAQGQAGLLDRGDYIWGRVRNPYKQASSHHVVEEDGAISAYVSFTQVDDKDGWYELAIKDLVINSEAGGRRLLAFLGAHQSMAGSATLFACPHHPLLTMQPEWRSKCTLNMHWMTRLVDVDAALSARGYPAGLELELALDVADDVVERNAGRRVLRIRGGRGEVEPGGDGSVRLDVRGLAALYTGFQTPENLMLQGLVDPGLSESSRAALRSAFAGSAPWMPSMF